jgi:hypothetical protein
MAYKDDIDYRWAVKDIIMPLGHTNTVAKHLHTNGAGWAAKP